MWQFTLNNQHDCTITNAIDHEGHMKNHNKKLVTLTAQLPLEHENNKEALL